MTDNEIVGERYTHWRDVYELQSDAGNYWLAQEAKKELSAWLAIQDVLGLIEGNGTQYPSNYFISKDTIFQAIANRIGGD